MNRTAPNSVAETGRASDRRRAFTLIELLVVIFILGILVTLVVSISAYILDKANRDQTLANQKVILAAIGAFHDITGDYPPDDPNLIDAGYPAALAGTDLSGYTLLYFLKGEEAFYANNEALQTRIQNATGKSLLNLSTDAFGASFEGFRDAYDRYMRYSIAGGLGGRPAIISAGPDGQFDTTDDIRSDGR